MSLYGMPLTISALVMGGSSSTFLPVVLPSSGQILTGYSKKRVIGVYGCMLVRCEPLPLPLFFRGGLSAVTKKNI